MISIRQDLILKIDESAKNMKKFDRFLADEFAQVNKSVVFMKSQSLNFENDLKNINFYVNSIVPVK